MFYQFNQNNSGGEFTFDKKGGVTHMVVIEADSHHDANKRAKNIGLYFGGFGDCPCCGDRWDELDDEEGDEVPMYWGEALSDVDFKDEITWMEVGKEVCVHYKDGRKVWF